MQEGPVCSGCAAREHDHAAERPAARAGAAGASDDLRVFQSIDRERGQIEGVMGRARERHPIKDQLPQSAAGATHHQETELTTIANHVLRDTGQTAQHVPYNIALLGLRQPVTLDDGVTAVHRGALGTGMESVNRQCGQAGQVGAGQLLLRLEGSRTQKSQS